MAVCCRHCFLKRSLPVLLGWKFRNPVNKCETTSELPKLYSTSVSGERVPSAGNIESVLPNQPSLGGLSIGDILTMNIDEKDVARHESITDWWDPNGPMKGLHAMNDLRISLIRNGLENSGKLKTEDIKTNPEYLTGLKIIEVGCGGGILCEPLARLGAEVTGIDPSQELIEVAKNHATDCAHTLKLAPTYINSNIEDHSSSVSNLYDAVVASEVIEHVPNKQIFLEACIKTLKPGGSIFLTTPNRTTASWLGAIIIAENVLKLLPKGIHSWDKFITPIELKQLLAKLGCKTVLINGMMFNVLNYTWSWSSSTLFHYAVHAVKTVMVMPSSSAAN